MAENVSLEMLMELLQRVQQEIREIKDLQRETLRRMNRIEQAHAHAAVTSAEQEARLDRLAERIDRIEQRLELRDQ
jgi:phage host-nuclease inhibitor protein Gam